MAPASQAAHWKTALRQAVTEPAELIRILDLDPAMLEGARLASRLFPLRVPRAFVDRMRRGDPADPLLRQVLPLDAEDSHVPGFLEDPVGDRAAVGTTGVLHKYHGRVLLIATGACAINCRYCFRRHFPYAEQTAARMHWRPALDYIASDDSIAEVILSGGDPLMLDTGKLSWLTDRLTGISHVRRLRIHTRMPVVLPERVDAAFCAWLSAVPLQKVVVVHANHPAELDAATDAAMAAIARTGTTLLNQAVLLRGVNDDAGTLVALGERLFAARVLPYYLHLLDQVRGAAHFQVVESRARTIHRALRERTSGFLVPRLVKEVAGAPSKTPLL